jgi:excisionase family DNA binding protein
MNEWIMVAECAELFGVSRQQVWRMIRSGRLPAKRFGSMYAVHRSNVARMVEYRAAKRILSEEPMGRRYR